MTLLLKIQFTVFHVYYCIVECKGKFASLYYEIFIVKFDFIIKIDVIKRNELFRDEFSQFSFL